MRQMWWLVMLAAAIGVGVVAWRLRETGTRTPDVPTTRSSEAPVRPPAERAEAETAPTATGAASRGATASAVPSAPFRDTVPTVETVTLSFVDDADRPVPGATATCRTGRSPPPDTPVVVADERGSVTTEVVADAEGRAEMPKFDAFANVVARKGRLYGLAHFTADDLRAPLKVVLRRGFDVEVTHDDGAPAAGVAVGMGSSNPSWRMTFAVETSDDGGVAVFDPDEVKNRLSIGEAAIVFRALVPGLPLGVAEAAASAPERGASADAAPIRLVLPPTGALTVRLMRADLKTPYATPAAVTVFDAGDAQQVEGFENAPEVAHLRRRSADGAVRFAHVVVGAALKIAVDPEADGERRVFATAVVPEAAREEATTVVVVGEPAVVVVGRLVDERGEPRPGAILYLQPRLAADASRTGMWASHGAGARTQSGGEFRAVFDVDPASFVARETRILIQNDGLAEELRSYLREPETLLVAHGGPDAAHVVNLGDVALPAHPQLAAGLVVDEAGLPLADAVVKFFRREGAAPKPNLAGGASAESALRYRQDHDARSVEARTGADGRFTLRGKAPPPAAGDTRCLGAVKDGYYLALHAPWPAATADARIELARAGGISGSIKTDGDASAQRSGKSHPFEVWIGGPPALGDGLWNYRPDQGLAQLQCYARTFDAAELRPGTGRVVFKVEGLDEPLLVVENVLIKAGEVNRDPRLQDVDLSRFVVARSIRILDEAGKPIPGALGHAKAAASWRWVSSPADAVGVARVSIFGASARVVVTAPGYVGVDLGEVTADAEVKLKRSAPCKIVFKLDPTIDLPENPYSLAVRAEWSAPEGGTLREEREPSHPFTEGFGAGDGGTFGKERLVVATVTQPGVYRAAVWFAQDDGYTKSATTFDSPAVFTVRPGDREVAVNVGVDAARLKELMKNGVR